MAKKAPRFVPCTLKALPEDLLLPAAATAARLNPANAPARGAGLDRQAIAVLTTAYWGAGGVKLGVAFLDNPPADLRARLLAHMNAWGATANVVFAEAGPGTAEVRVTRTARQGYWSYLGTGILHVARGAPTMNLDSFTMQTPESEFHRVVRHETGHTLGFPHEHLRPEEVARLDPAKALAYFQRTQGWSAEVVRSNVLTPLRPGDITGPGTEPTAPDEDSVMCYQLPGSITRDGKPIRGGSDINANDAAFAGKIYPKAVVTPPPPQPPGPPVVPPAGDGFAYLATLDAAGRVLRRYRAAEESA